MATFAEFTEKQKKKKKAEEIFQPKKMRAFADFTKEALGQDDDIAPVVKRKTKTTEIAPLDSIGQTRLESTKAYKEQKERRQKESDGFFKKSLAYEDGHHKNTSGFGKAALTTVATASDVAAGILQGFGNMGEGIVDLATYGVAGVSDLLGADEFAEDTKKFAQKEWVNKGFDWLGSEKGAGYEDYSVLGDKSDSVAQGIGQVLGMYVTAGVGGYAGLGAKATSALVTGVNFASSTGHGVTEAYDDGASDGEAWTYGILKGGAEAGSEAMLGGLGKGAKALGVSHGLSSADDMLAKALTKKITNRFLSNTVQLGIKAGGEGLEEVAAGFGSAVAKKLSYKRNNGENLWDLVEDEKLLDSFVIGALTSGITQGGGAIKATKTDTDLVSGLNRNEETVVNKVYEDAIANEEKAQGRKLTISEKNKLYDSVVRGMEKGAISTDTIESVLGGDTYKAYKNNTDKIANLQEEIASLQEEHDKLNAMKKGEMTGVQDDRLTELKNKLPELKEQLKALENDPNTASLKTQLSNEVYELVKGDRLSESYNERVRRTQVYEADTTKYDKKQAEVIQKAIDSGVLNNTNRTHEFVDMVAKISADKGVSFDFTNNTKLKESGFAVDGKQVNGYVTKDGITLNIDSHKITESVVGHEITHVLEGTELYTTLQEAVKQYATTKGEYDTRLKELTETYKNVKDANIENELTADIIGDYLFDDPDFINSLSTQHRNVFQKIYDEIKYLCKIATAGSKEARELERVKKAFDKAYRENGKAQTESDTNAESVEMNGDAETKYSLVSDDATIDFLENQPYVVTYKAMQVIDGKLYPPMAAEEKVQEEYTNKKGEKKTRTVKKLKQPSELGKWQQSDERPDLAKQNYDEKKGYSSFTLLKGNGKELKGVAYNPYEHTSNIVLNDQFSSAHRRDNLVTVEYHIPVSELTSGYKAQYAESAVGKRDWHTGLVASKLKNSHRDVYLTRWSKPVRILSDAEVAQKYKEILEKEDGVTVPWNVVTQSLREELEKVGVAIDYSDKKIGTATFNFDASLRGEYLEQTKKSKKKTVKYSLSPEQQEYFKDSVVRDENGDLKVMYHGTSKGGHTVFDTFGESRFGLFGAGTYFTDNKDIAQTYTEKGRGTNPQVYESYLNITNPIDMDAQADIEAWKKAFHDADYSNCKTNEDCFRAMKEVFIDEEYPQWEAKDTALDVLQSMGYDGITHIGGGRVNADGTRHQVYIAFEPEQIKNIDNVKPTSDPDIRYSISEETDSIKSENKILGLERQIAEIEEEFANDIFDDIPADERKEMNNRLWKLRHELGKLEDAERRASKKTSLAEIRDNLDNYRYIDLRSLAEGFGWDEYDDMSKPQLASALRDYLNDVEEEWNEEGNDFYSAKHGTWVRPIESGESNNSKIIQFPTKYQTRYSLSTDNEGNKLTVQQETYFKDSKAVDNNGNLLKVYHTTKNDFTVFDKSKKGEATEDANTYLGFFFSDDAEYMQNFPEFKDGKTESYYLNMTNPIDMTNISKDAFLDIVEVLGGDVDEASIVFDEELEAEQKRAKLRGDNNVSLTLSNLLDTLTGEYYYEDFYRELQPHYDELMSKGYDGVINYMDELFGAKEYIVLDSNQAKLTSNTNPTADADIRYSVSDRETNTKLNEVGLNYDSKSETVSYSLSSLEDAFNYKTDENGLLINEGDYVKARDEYVNALAKSIAVDKGNPTQEEIEKANRYLDGLFLVHDMIAKDKDKLDYEAAVNKSAWVSNSEYGGSIDFSTLCAKRRLFTGTFDAIQEALPDTVLTDKDFLNIRNLLLESDQESPCSMCYVEGSRANHGKYVDKWLKEYLKTDPEWKPQIADFTSTTRLEQTRINHPEAYAEYVKAMNKLSQRKPKEASVRTDYKGEILVEFADGSSVEIKNKNGGIRFNSFSDFEIIHALDCMQVITDMARVGLNGQAYTKVKEFAEAFGNTGLKINLSLVAKGVDENGKLIMDEVNGMKYAEAIDIRNRYSDNVGTVVVVFTPQQLEAALADNTIDFVLPFHRSQWRKAQYALMGLPEGTKDFTNAQNDRIRNPKTGRPVKLSKIKHVSTYTNDMGETFDIKDNIMPNQYWDFDLSGRENANRYLDYINANGMTPKFDFVLDKVDGKWVLPKGAVGDGYFKLLIDFKMYNNNGIGSPQNPVLPEFNMPYIQDMLTNYIGGHKSFPVAHDVVDKFVEGKKNGQYSLSELDEHPIKRWGLTYGDDIRFDAPIREDIAPTDSVVEENATSESTVPVPTVEESATVEDAEVPTKDIEKDSNLPRWAENQIANYKDTIAEERANAKGRKKASNVSVKRYISQKPTKRNDGRPNVTTQGAKVLDGKQYMSYNGRFVLELNTPDESIPVNEQLAVDSIKGIFEKVDKDIIEGNYNIDAIDISLIRKEVPKGTSRKNLVVVGDSYFDIDYVDAVLRAIENPEISLSNFIGNDKALVIKGSNGQSIIAPVHIDSESNLYETSFVYRAEKVGAGEITDAPIKSAPIKDAPIVETAPTVAETSPIEDAPIKATESEAIKPAPEKLEGEEAEWASNKMARADTGDTEQTANILTEEPKTVENKKRGLWSFFKESVLDKGMVFESLSKKHKNRELESKWNFIRYADGNAQTLIGKGANGVKSLKDIQAEVEETGLTKEFYEYLYHKHNVDRMNLEGRYEGVKNKPVFGYSVTAEASQDIVNQYEFAEPKFIEYANDVYNYMNHLRNMMVENGVISQETAELWAEMYPHYVPIRRVGDTGLNVNVPLDTGRTSVNAPVKAATGGSRDILPLFDTMAQRTMQTYKAVAKNSFGVELKNTLGTTVKSDKAKLDDIIDGIDTQEDLLQEGKNGNKPTFTVFENGERVTFEITEEMYDALKPKGEKLAYRNKFLSGLSTLQRGLLTEYNPVFMLTNAVKDVQDVLINSQHAVKTYANFPKAIAEMVSKGKYYTEYMQNGGGQNTYFDNDSNTFTEDKKGIRKVIGMPLDIISGANNVIERLPRLAEYMASRKSGRSIEVSMLDAARVTTNFAAGGDITKFLNGNGCTFLNASVQGAVQQVRNIQEAKMNGLKGWVGLATKFAVAGLPAMLLNHLMWDDDEEYEELADYVKENYYIVAKYGDGKFVRIPKGRTLAVIQNAMEQIKNAATGDDEADLKSFLELAVSNLAPNNPLDNNIIAPITQVMRNKTWYGDDLVPTRLQDRPASEQYDESTDAISKWLGEKINYSPYKINYLLNQYSGGVGDVVLPMLTPEAESGDNSLGGNIIAPLKDKFTTDSVMNNQNISDFYDTVDELSTNAKSSKATDEDILKSKYMNSVNSELGELYGQKREIQSSNLSDKEKYAKVRDIQKQIDTIAEDSLNTYNNISYDGDYAKIGDKYFQWYTPEGSDPYWRKLTESQTTKYLVTKAAGNSNYATDGTVHYRRDEDGEWTKISDKQLERQNEVTKELDITPEEYWSKTEISFLPMSNGEYEYAYENPEKYAVAKAVGGYDAYKSYSNDLYDIHADKDSNGKSISGSRKEKVIDYINNLDIDYGAKLILHKSEYPSDDTYNYEIIDYLNSREDISYSEMETILTELGFKVHADGTISWD